MDKTTQKVWDTIIAKWISWTHKILRKRMRWREKVLFGENFVEWSRWQYTLYPMHTLGAPFLQFFGGGVKLRYFSPWNSQPSHLKMNGWNTILSFWGPGPFSGEKNSFVSFFRDCAYTLLPGILWFLLFHEDLSGIGGSDLHRRKMTSWTKRASQTDKTQPNRHN